MSFQITLLKYDRGELLLSDHKPVKGLFCMQVLQINTKKREKVQEELLGKYQNEMLKSTTSLRLNNPSPIATFDEVDDLYYDFTSSSRDNSSTKPSFSADDPDEFFDVLTISSNRTPDLPPKPESSSKPVPTIKISKEDSNEVIKASQLPPPPRPPKPNKYPVINSDLISFE